MSRFIAPLTACAAALMLAACDAAGPTDPQAAPQPRLGMAAQGATVDNGHYESPIGGLLFFCGGEQIIASGTFVANWHTTVRPDGSWMQSQHIKIEMSGEGIVTGTKYLGRGTDNTTIVYTLPRDGVYSYRSVHRMRNIVQGSADNYVFDAHIRWTINAAGEVTAEMFKIESNCRG